MSNNTTQQTRPSLESLYLEGNYKGLEEELSKKQDLLSASTFNYNMGTVLAKQGKIGEARFFLEKSKIEGNVSADLRNNLDYVVSKIEGGESVNTFSLENVSLWPSSAFLAASLFLILLSLVLVRLKVVTKKIFVGFMLLFSLIPYSIHALYLNSFKTAIVLKESSLREGPSALFPELRKIPEGSKVVLSDYNNGNYLVKSPKRLVGWISKSDLGIIK